MAKARTRSGSARLVSTIALRTDTTADGAISFSLQSLCPGQPEALRMVHFLHLAGRRADGARRADASGILQSVVSGGQGVGEKQGAILMEFVKVPQPARITVHEARSDRLQNRRQRIIDDQVAGGLPRRKFEGDQDAVADGQFAAARLVVAVQTLIAPLQCEPVVLPGLRGAGRAGFEPGGGGEMARRSL